jgi:flagellar basal body-associated protein FliL
MSEGELIMYYEGRWEREYFEKKPKFQEVSIWQLLVLLVVLVLAATVLLVFWVFIGNYIDVSTCLPYLGEQTICTIDF